MISKAFAVGLRKLAIASTTVVVIGFSTTAAFAQPANKLYSPIPLPLSNEISDMLSDKDIPTGQGGYARDYMVKLSKGDNLAIDLVSESFDAIITLLAPDGTTVAENDDGPDGSSNSLLFTRVSETGSYIVRVRSFGETGIGAFKLKVTRLQPVKGS
ncbi:MULTISPECIES: PPC domain-containing protein [Nostocales]|uniref:Peptidase n=3 Tax=Nostocales TaxID=1161 RepID=A0A0C1RD60_9CYAN|nr:PPC domain-containing protein [Tolypothrix bouteillei]KAF3884202.1 peptidase [Tolypothrix bouteillei VB521301]